MTIDEIKNANESAGYFFFDPSHTRSLRSIISRTVYEGPGGVYFTTSEQHAPSEPRMYTVRKFNPKTGAVKTVEGFDEITSQPIAANAAKKLASDPLTGDSRGSHTRS